MDPKLVGTINSTPEEFAAWLECQVEEMAATEFRHYSNYSLNALYLMVEGDFFLDAVNTERCANGYRIEIPAYYDIFDRQESKGTAIEINVAQSGECSEIRLGYQAFAIEAFWQLLLNIADQWPEMKLEAVKQATLRKTALVKGKLKEFEAIRRGGKEARGPTLRTQARAYLYKSIKDEHPEFSQTGVAIKANQKESTDVHSMNSVSNTYRAMRWKWERADRIR